MIKNWRANHSGSDLEAHTKNLFEILRIGDNYIFPTEGGATTQIVNANQMLAFPFLVARDITVDRIAVHVSTADAGKNARLGIYNNGTNLYPGTLVLDAGVVSVNATGVQAITIDQALTKGLYWLVLVSDGTPTFRARSSLTTILGGDATNFATIVLGWKVTFTYAALPNPFTAGGALASNFFGLMIGLRPSSLD